MYMHVFFNPLYMYCGHSISIPILCFIFKFQNDKYGFDERIVIKLINFYLIFFLNIFEF